MVSIGACFKLVRFYYTHKLYRNLNLKTLIDTYDNKGSLRLSKDQLDHKNYILYTYNFIYTYTPHNYS